MCIESWLTMVGMIHETVHQVQMQSRLLVVPMEFDVGQVG